MLVNPILASDSYKVGQAVQYPPGTTGIYSYLESRGGEFAETTFFGLQYIIHRFFANPIRKMDIGDAEDVLYRHFGSRVIFNAARWEHILTEHDGFLPLRIKAVPEGTTVPTHNVLMTIENTCPQCFWVTNYMETVLSQVWYPTTVCTLSRHVKKLIKAGLEKSGDVAGLEYKLHDFGFRGATSYESAGIGGAAHLVNFRGTDTLVALRICRDNYHEPNAGFSIPASEHSTITSWGRENEENAYRNFLYQYWNEPMYACVTDSYNFNRAVMEIWGDKLKGIVMAAKGKLIIRHDSGDPIKGTLEALQCMAWKFGFTFNAKGYKVINPKVGFLWGDGLDYAKIELMIDTLLYNGWSLDNVAFGMGGGLLQKVNRDTQKFAIKCSSATINGKEIDVFKAPVGDPGKASRTGRLGLFLANGQYWTSQLGAHKDVFDVLRTVYENGHLPVNDTLNNIRERAAL